MLLKSLKQQLDPMHTELRQCVPCDVQWRGSLVSRCFNCGELGIAGWKSSPIIRTALENGEHHAVYPGEAPEPARF